MSVQYRHYCDKYIDTDFTVEHFIPENDSYECIIEEDDNNFRSEVLE